MVYRGSFHSASMWRTATLPRSMIHSYWSANSGNSSTCWGGVHEIDESQG